MRAKFGLLAVATILFSLLQAFKLPISRDWYDKRDSISTMGKRSWPPIPFYWQDFKCSNDSFTRSDYEAARGVIDKQLGPNGIYVDAGSFVQNSSGSATAYVCNYRSTWFPTWAVIFDSRSYDRFSDKLDEQCGEEGAGWEKWQFMWVSTSYGRGNAANAICTDGTMYPPPPPLGVGSSNGTMPSGNGTMPSEG